MCGARDKMATVDTRVKNVNKTKQSLSITRAANFQSLHSLWRLSSCFTFSVKLLSSCNISLSSATERPDWEYNLSSVRSGNIVAFITDGGWGSSCIAVLWLVGLSLGTVTSTKAAPLPGKPPHNEVTIFSLMELFCVRWFARWQHEFMPFERLQKDVSLIARWRFCFVTSTFAVWLSYWLAQ